MRLSIWVSCQSQAARESFLRDRAKACCTESARTERNDERKSDRSRIAMKQCTFCFNFGNSFMRGIFFLYDKFVISNFYCTNCYLLVLILIDFSTNTY